MSVFLCFFMLYYSFAACQALRMCMNVRHTNTIWLIDWLIIRKCLNVSGSSRTVWSKQSFPAKAWKVLTFPELSDQNGRFREKPDSFRHFQNYLIKAVISGKSLAVWDISRTVWSKQSFPGKAWKILTFPDLSDLNSRFREKPDSFRHFQNCLIKAVISGKSLTVSDISRTVWSKQSFPGKAGKVLTFPELSDLNSRFREKPKGFRHFQNCLIKTVVSVNAWIPCKLWM